MEQDTAMQQEHLAHEKAVHDWKQEMQRVRQQQPPPLPTGARPTALAAETNLRCAPDVRAALHASDPANGRPASATEVVATAYSWITGFQFWSKAQCCAFGSKIGKAARFELMMYDRPGFLPKWHFCKDNSDVPGSLKWRKPSTIWNKWPGIGNHRLVSVSG